MTSEQQRLVELNQAEYGPDYDSLPFPSPERAAAALTRRSQLLERLRPHAAETAGGSKLFTGTLSPGCRRCVDGTWSCLFVNGRCNARCFYCPASQDETGLPTTNTVQFRTPAAYADYLERFAFTGASLSGGEPLLTPGRTLGFLAAIRRKLGDGAHLWLYTNGTLLTAELVEKLHDAGLDEIRFDIGAVGYRLDQVAMAVGRIPTVTVEIPAVPEEASRLREKLREMAAIGVSHLNLHQLRLTPYSLPRFRGRPYTYLHGEKVTVLESELLALELMLEAAEAGLALPVNYCSFVFKNRWQKVAARRRNGDFLRKGWEDLAATGLIRTLALTGPPETLARQAEALQAAADPGRWTVETSRLAFAAGLWPHLDFNGCCLAVSWHDTGQRTAVSYRNPFREVKLTGGEKLVVERWRTGEAVLEGEEIGAFHRRFLAADPAESRLADLQRFETVPAGLQDYF